jgi:hypothetical protein
MLLGSADVADLAARAPVVPEFQSESLELGEVVCLQLSAEMPNSAREAVLPPGLHPTVPAAMSLQVFSAARSPWGELGLAVLRVSCRSGVRARGFTIGAVASSDAAASGLSSSLGFPIQVGEVSLRHGYDGTDISVTNDDLTLAIFGAVDPEPMGENDVQFTGTLNLAQTPLGLRLMQVESACSPTQVERLTPGSLFLDGAAWGESLIEPSMVIAASVVVAPSWTFAPVRFVCKPDELAFTGTEAVT